MKEIIKNSIAGFLAGIMATIGGFGIANLVEEEIDLDAIAIEAAEMVNVPDAIRGERGYTGVVGKDGVAGKDGKDGINGANAVVDMDKLTDMVADEMESRDDAPILVKSGQVGNFNYLFDVENSGIYAFTLKHFGSGDFEVSLEDEDGNLTTLVDTTGHVNINTDVTLDDDMDYTLHVSADGDWKIEIKK